MSPAKPKAPAQTRQRKPVRRKIYGEKHIYGFLLVICLLQTLFLGGLIFILVSLQIPDLSNVANYRPHEATIIYDRYGKIIDRMYLENRTVIGMDKMASHLAEAFVAAEDGRFYEHPGLDLFSVLRAALVNLKAGAKSQGGSTITQQVAKSLLLTPEKTYIRKFKEAILAWRIDKMLSKEEILYIYLNQIYLGEGSYGVEAAAQTYFGKSAAKLSLAECALLAGLPQAPSRYSLFNHLDRAVARQKYVLNRMAADGYIKAEEAKKAYGQKIRLATKRTKKTREEGGYYLQMVKKRAREYLGMPLQQAGARIYTHFDPAMQQKAVAAIRAGVRHGEKRARSSGKGGGKTLQGALVAMETESAAVRALVGGVSFSSSPFDRASQARRPAGSTFKPFVYTAALLNGATRGSQVLDAPITIGGRDGGSWRPQNYDGKYHGKTSYEKALAQSLNTAAVRVLQDVGYKPVHQLANNMGITAKLPPDLSLALGAADVSLLELTGAYGVFAGGGVFQKPSFIRRIKRLDGVVVEPKKKKSQRVLPQKVAREAALMLQKAIYQGTGRAVATVPGARGGKTGTSNDYRDAWFVGYDESYTVGVWVGYDRNQSMGRSGTGGGMAAPIWRDFMMARKTK